ncbi:TetR family transcriptional regulator [Micromonospora phytophila]|uniref:TetR/AcrR family transcriptional regulator n=1 Tax=Micromonospora phytophila TaxID=709888 RepID=UPI0020300305|nr:TetR family transcriptional regulator [Micromonospora phytophila]MCM0674510.1 TetR family transcriptional regulator [Micromonospora phytophila]
MAETHRRRSDATRAAIRDAARERFAADGYERATIRAIASDARIDPSMVIRYFNSKEKLFAAAAEFDLQLPDSRSIAHAEAGWALVGHFLDRWEGDDTLLALLRTAVTHAAAAERIRAVFADQLAPLLAELCDDRAQVPTRAGLVATQMLGLALSRYVLGIGPITELDRDAIIAWLGPTIHRYITARNPTDASPLTTSP